jgi:predicted metal-dependent HD superfamily phosphohydrolase
MTDLRASWVRAWRGIGSRTDSDASCHALVTRYSEPHRKYHTLQHLRECLVLFESVRGLALNPAEVEVALWFHDAIYDVQRHDNEAQSAAWARTAALEAGASPLAAERIHALVMVTQHTGSPGAADEQLLVDIDLAILGAGTERFAEYERQIRDEYAHVPAALFEHKRREILRSFLGRPRLYGTAHFHGTLETQARENLRIAIGDPEA